MIDAVEHKVMWFGGEVQAGRRGDAQDRWAVERVVAVRRPEKRRGQQLEVLVRFSGVDASGAAPCVAVPLSSAAKHVATAIFPLNFPER